MEKNRKLMRRKLKLLCLLMVICDVFGMEWGYDESHLYFKSRDRNSTLVTSPRSPFWRWRGMGRVGRGWVDGRGQDRNLNIDSNWRRQELRERKKSEGNRRLDTLGTQSCCPIIHEVIEPLSAKNRTGNLVELFTDENVRQRFYETSCHPGILGENCKFLSRAHSKVSRCVQEYSFTYALVRTHRSYDPWALDYISIRSGCSCKVFSSRRRRKFRLKKF